MPNDTPVTGLRLRRDARARLEEMAKAGDRSMASVTNAAINVFYDQYLELRRDREQLASRGMEVLRMAEERLGKRFYSGCGEAAFERMPNGEVAVNINDEGYFEAPGGRLMKARMRNGHAEYAEIDADGTVGGWVLAMDPILMN